MDANALGVNVSDVGMCLFVIANLPLGSHIEIEFLAPDGAEKIRTFGTVRHRALYLYGIEFLPASEQSPPIETAHTKLDRALG